MSLGRNQKTGVATQSPIRSRNTLDVRSILQTALGIVDREGLAALTMRRLADALGVSATAIYWHVRNREQLLQGIFDLATEQVELSVPTEGSWEDQARSLCRAIRAQHLAHPNVFLLADQFTTESARPVASAFVRIAESAGYRGLELFEVVSVLMNYAIGSTWIEMRDTRQPDVQSAWLAVTELDELHSVMRSLLEVDREVSFERGLEYLIEGLRRGANQ